MAAFETSIPNIIFGRHKLRYSEEYLAPHLAFTVDVRRYDGKNGASGGHINVSATLRMSQKIDYSEGSPLGVAMTLSMVNVEVPFENSTWKYIIADDKTSGATTYGYEATMSVPLKDSVPDYTSLNSFKSSCGMLRVVFRNVNHPMDPFTRSVTPWRNTASTVNVDPTFDVGDFGGNRELASAHVRMVHSGFVFATSDDTFIPIKLIDYERHMVEAFDATHSPLRTLSEDKVLFAAHCDASVVAAFIWRFLIFGKKHLSLGMELDARTCMLARMLKYRDATVIEISDSESEVDMALAEALDKDLDD